jgi:hypothetical protein
MAAATDTSGPGFFVRLCDLQGQPVSDAWVQWVAALPPTARNAEVELGAPRNETNSLAHWQAHSAMMSVLSAQTEHVARC